MFLLTEDQFSELESLFNSGSPTLFADIHDQIYARVQDPDVLGNVADGKVVAWFGVGAQTDRRGLPAASRRFPVLDNHPLCLGGCAG